MSVADTFMRYFENKTLKRSLIISHGHSLGGILAGLSWKKNTHGVCETFATKFPDNSLIKCSCFVPYNGSMTIKLQKIDFEKKG